MLLGAEVLYFRGISQLDDLSELCLQGTRLLLLEMPFRKWTANEVDEVCRITQTTGLVIMLAHIERYLAWQSKGVWKQLQEHGVIMQVNVSFFAQSSFSLRALRMLRSDKIQVLGTDTHNLHSRPPYMDRARDTILKYLGKNMWNKLERQSYGYLEANRK